MNYTSLPLAGSFAIMSGIALTQIALTQIALAQGTEDPVAQLRACSLLEHGERLECLDKLSRTIAPPHRPASKGDNWIVSQTTSPVDYGPIATATTASSDATGSPMQLTVRCRGGRTELTIAGAAMSANGEDYVISYRINDGQPVQLPATAPASGAGVAFKGDVVRLLQSLPDNGSLAIHLSPRAGTAYDGIFSLAGLGAVRAKIAATCNWPHAIAKPND